MTLEEVVLEILLSTPFEEAFLVFLRVGVVFAFLPILGSATVSMRIRVVLSLACTAMVIPFVVTGEMTWSRRSEYIEDCSFELLAGFFVGFMCRSLFWIIEFSGAIASQSISLSQLLGNQSENPLPAMAQFLYYGALALAAYLNFPEWVVRIMTESYSIMPLANPVDIGLIAEIGIETIARVFYIAVGLAGPFIIIGLLYNLCLGVVNKAMPQLMVAFVGAPAITWIGIALLALTAPVFLNIWSDQFLAFNLREGLR